MTGEDGERTLVPPPAAQLNLAPRQWQTKTEYTLFPARQMYADNRYGISRRRSMPALTQILPAATLLLTVLLR